VTAASKAVVSVREQLVGVSVPSDAVLTATGATGTFKPNADGTFSADSKITFDVTTLASDNRDRDNFVKMDTLQTRQFPKADFVPTKATGLTLPLATTGTFTFKLTGNLTIHGKTKEVTFDVVAKRSGADLTATATLAPSVKFGDFGMSAPSVPFRVVSIVDEIRLVVELVATAAAA
jgi:polyisoprenoid-binding protein YceI